jgi:hypothetical protein
VREVSGSALESPRLTFSPRANKTVVRVTRCHLPEDDNHHSHRRGNLKSYKDCSSLPDCNKLKKQYFQWCSITVKNSVKFTITGLLIAQGVTAQRCVQARVISCEIYGGRRFISKFLQFLAPHLSIITSYSSITAP